LAATVISREQLGAQLIRATLAVHDIFEF